MIFTCVSKTIFAHHNSKEIVLLFDIKENQNIEQELRKTSALAMLSIEMYFIENIVSFNELIIHYLANTKANCEPASLYLII